MDPRSARSQGLVVLQWKGDVTLIQKTFDLDKKCEFLYETLGHGAKNLDPVIRSMCFREAGEMHIFVRHFSNRYIQKIFLMNYVILFYYEVIFCH